MTPLKERKNHPIYIFSPVSDSVSPFCRDSCFVQGLEINRYHSLALTGLSRWEESTQAKAWESVGFWSQFRPEGPWKLSPGFSLGVALQ
jgi:hypothetical protein